MLKALPYAISGFLVIALTYTSFNWGILHERNKQAQTTIQSLAKSAEHIISEENKRQQIEDIITNDKDDSRTSSPVILRTLHRVVRDCSGKTSC